MSIITCFLSAVQKNQLEHDTSIPVIVVLCIHLGHLYAILKYYASVYVHAMTRPDISISYCKWHIPGYTGDVIHVPYWTLFNIFYWSVLDIVGI